MCAFVSLCVSVHVSMCACVCDCVCVSLFSSAMFELAQFNVLARSFFSFAQFNVLAHSFLSFAQFNVLAHSFLSFAQFGVLFPQGCSLKVWSWDPHSLYAPWLFLSLGVWHTTHTAVCGKSISRATSIGWSGKTALCMGTHTIAHCVGKLPMDHIWYQEST